jgi:hypothetical protein
MSALSGTSDADLLESAVAVSSLEPCGGICGEADMAFRDRPSQMQLWPPRYRNQSGASDRHGICSVEQMYSSHS